MTKKPRRKVPRPGSIERDCWSLDVALAEWLIPRLRHLAKAKQGLPAEVFPPGPWADDGSYPPHVWREAKKKWAGILKEMVVGLELLVAWELCPRTRLAKIQRSFDLLAEYWGNLWD